MTEASARSPREPQKNGGEIERVRDDEFRRAPLLHKRSDERIASRAASNGGSKCTPFESTREVIPNHERTASSHESAERSYSKYCAEATNP